MSIVSDGYLFVPGCIDRETLDALRAEADHLFHLKRAKQDALSEDEYFDKGCALDFFTDHELHEDDAARTCADAYIGRRIGAHRSGHHDDHDTSSEAGDNGDAKPRPGTGKDEISGGSWGSRHVSIMRGALFQSLASLASDALMAERSMRDSPAASNAHTGDLTDCSTNNAPVVSLLQHVAAADSEQHGDDADDGVDGYKAMHEETGKQKTRDAWTKAAKRRTCQDPLLFNEQYVVKPPRSSINFGWHTDEREQLAMCVFARGVPPPVYVSVWLALDDCDAINGCLEVHPQAWDKPRVRAPREEDESGVVCIPAKASDAVVFLSNVWHRSGPNRTENPRRVFYAQYCLDVIRAAPRDPRPLSLAIPCSCNHTPDAGERAQYLAPNRRAGENTKIAERGETALPQKGSSHPRSGLRKRRPEVEQNNMGQGELGGSGSKRVRGGGV